jgi:DNA helicase-2/ATP-dependent DNA helicase PcrA
VTATTALRPEALRDLLGIALTEEQLVAASAPLEPGVVVAGAGSGKTTVMAARVVWLVASGQVRPDQVLGLTFTNKAAAELAHRIRSALSALSTPSALSALSALSARPSAPAVSGEATDPGEPTVSTYHAYAGRLLREHGLWIGVEPQARLLADATRFQLADRVLRRARGPFVELDKTVASLVGDLVQLDGEMSEHLVAPDRLVAVDARVRADVATAPKLTQRLTDVSRTATRRDELTSLVVALRAEKDRLGVLDFGDQLAFAAALVREHGTVAEVERDRFRVVLLDEYQDTSHAQQQLLSGLVGAGHPVTAVGDPCQAIYGWRGASVANIDRFPQDFRRADGAAAARFPLTRNNRSGERLLTLANVLSEPLRELHPGVGTLEPRPEAVGSGLVECALHETYAGEVSWVCDRIASLVAAGTRPRDVAVLVRARSDFPAYHDALVARGVPVEVVGLGGLLSLPEVADLVAMLSILDDTAANPALVRLLAGPRWQIGPRDLALLGRRAAELVRSPEPDDYGASEAGDRGDAGGTGDADGADDPADAAEPADIERLLEEAVSGVDPVDVVSLLEALDHPGGRRYSAAARARFARLSAELRELRRHLGEPLLDLLQRVVRTTGLDVEVGAGPLAARTRRSDAIGAFLDHAAAFADLEGDPSVRAFLAYLRAADEFERGLDTAAPSPGDSVKLLTVHKAKGLEWPVVVLPDLSAGVFPGVKGRPRFTKSSSALPTELRGDAGDFPPTPRSWTTRSLDEYENGIKDLDRMEELRLAYVAVTRAKDLLVASGHWWGPSQVKPRGPSPYLVTVRDACLSGAGAVVTWAPEPLDERNPHLVRSRELVWPVPLAPTALRARRDAARWVVAAMASPPALFDVRGSAAGPGETDLTRIAAWDRDIDVLLDEARRAHRIDLDVPLPTSLSASALVRLARDPDGLARDLARPMPRPPAPAAARGTRFHGWVESLFGVVPLIDRTELGGAADDALDDDDLAALQKAFLAGPYGARSPYRVEAPFQLVLGEHVIRGRIDAVYRTDDGFDVVDWKTGRTPADPLQLAVYRIAWARVAGVPEDAVGAAFYYVPTGEVVRPVELPDASEVVRLLSGA